MDFLIFIAFASILGALFLPIFGLQRARALLTVAFAFVLVNLLVPLVAFAQEVADGAGEDPTWLKYLASALGLIAGSGLLSTFIKSNNVVMKVIDLLALNWGKARNDPSAN